MPGTVKVLTGQRIYLSLATMIRRCDSFSAMKIASPFLSDLPLVFLYRLPLDLARKASEGAEIQILTRPTDDERILFVLNQWLNSGVEIRINSLLHGKVVLFRRRVAERKRIVREEHTALVGSANLTGAGLSVQGRKNLEIMICFQQKDIWNKISKVYSKWWMARESFDYLTWKLRGKYQKR